MCHTRFLFSQNSKKLKTYRTCLFSTFAFPNNFEHQLLMFCCLFEIDWVFIIHKFFIIIILMAKYYWILKKNLKCWFNIYRYDTLNSSTLITWSAPSLLKSCIWNTIRIICCQNGTYNGCCTMDLKFMKGWVEEFVNCTSWLI